MTRTARLAVVALLVGGFTVGVATSATAAPVSVTIDGIEYSANDESVAAGATIVDYTPGTTDVVIPATVEISGTTYDVTAIGEDAFFNKGLTSVTIPDSVTTIGRTAFAFNDLATLSIPDSMTTIGSQVFRDNALTSVTIPDGVTSIEFGAFANNDLTTLSIPDSVTTIGSIAFANNALTALTIPDGVTTIESNAFGNNALTSVTIPDSVTTIGTFAFGDNDLDTVTIPDSVTTIGAQAFRGNALSTLTIPTSVTTIDESAFSNNALTTVTIPTSVTTMGSFAFEGNPLDTVTMQGAAPSTGTSVFGTGDPLVTYPWQFDESQTAGGYTSPTWASYDSQALATVAFDTAGGSAAPADQSIIVGSIITEPTEPTRDGFTFDGWFTAPSGGTAWSFSDALSATALDAAGTGGTPADLVLFAQWSEPELADTGVEVATTGSLAVGLLLAGALALLINRRAGASGR